MSIANALQSFLAARYCAHQLVAHGNQPFFNLHSHNGLIFNNKNACVIHGFFPGLLLPGSGNVTQKTAPALSEGPASNCPVTCVVCDALKFTPHRGSPRSARNVNNTRTARLMPSIPGKWKWPLDAGDCHLPLAGPVQKTFESSGVETTTILIYSNRRRKKTLVVHHGK
jgi:hypothetical protein